MVTEPDPHSRWTELDKFRKPTPKYNTKRLEILATIIVVVVCVAAGVLYGLFELADETDLDPVYHKIHDALPDIEGPLHSDHDNEP